MPAVCVSVYLSVCLSVCLYLLATLRKSTEQIFVKILPQMYL